MVEADRVGDAELVGRAQARPLGAPHHFHRPQHLQVTTRDLVWPQPGFVDEDHEGRRAAVHHGDLGTVHLHQHIVHAQGIEGGEEVLDGVDGDPVAAERGGVIEAPQMVDMGGDLDSHVGAAEADAVFGGRGLEVEADGTAGVQADARAAHAALESSPIRHETWAGALQ
jgi:hypothetical protein